MNTTPGGAFLAARDFLQAHCNDYERAYAGFQWPVLDEFNWALDFFDVQSSYNERTALWIVNEDGSESRSSFANLTERSNRVANWLRGLGVARGDRVLVMLPNITPLWEISLALMKLGAVASPASTLLSSPEAIDRIERGAVGHIITDTANIANFDTLTKPCTRIVVGDQAPGWTSFSQADGASATFTPQGVTRATDPLLLYFTSGTTAKPKMVLHSHQSYPMGHLSTMYWIGLQPGDIHWNISSPGWAKHAWSCLFAPWNAGACVFIYNQPRFDAKRTLQTLVRHGITSLCAPPTVWRSLILEPLAEYPVKLRALVSAGEPLNPQIIDTVQRAWAINIRDGYGQTETTCVIGNSPGQPIEAGSVGRPMPGYRIALLDADGKSANLGEINLQLRPSPVGLMIDYPGDRQRTADLLTGDYFSTSDIATRDEKGYFHYVGRVDDVFKSSDYRISPFELESLLIEHEAVAEAAVVPSPDALRLSVPKAYIVLKPDVEACAQVAQSILRFVAAGTAPYKRIRRIEFADLPKTISGKIRRAQLRQAEHEHGRKRGPLEFWEEDFPAFKRAT